MTEAMRTSAGTTARAPGRGSGVRHFEDALRRRSDKLTPAERAIAAYLREHLASLPFETGASIAARAGVSEMSVSRFIRSLGYANLKELKADLRAGFADDGLDDILVRFQVRADGAALRESLQLEVRAIVNAYNAATTDRWRRIVDLLCRSEHVHVAGFQAVRGLALDFATRLTYARDGVRFAEGVSGTFSEVFDTEAPRSCLVLVDTVSYAHKARLLAGKARDMGFPIVVVTDKFSHWAYEFTENVVEGYTQTRLFWDSTASLSTILTLLINSVAVRLGRKAEERFQALRSFGDHFEEFEP
jgi:DNA-binding MurR/RpiR family transcriptional regulator